MRYFSVVSGSHLRLDEARLRIVGSFVLRLALYGGIDRQVAGSLLQSLFRCVQVLVEGSRGRTLFRDWDGFSHELGDGFSVASASLLWAASQHCKHTALGQSLEYA